MSYKRLVSYVMFAMMSIILFTLSCETPGESEFEKHTVTGTVFKAGTNEGIAGIAITVEPSDIGSTTTNQDGSYILNGLVQGQTYTIKANAGQVNTDYTEDEYVIRAVNEDRNNADMTIMSTRGDVVGIVTNSLDNEPLEGVRVTITPGNESRNTGTDGIYTFDNLLEREYTLQFVKSGFESDTKTITTVAANTQNGDIALTPLAPITVDPSQINFGTSLTSEVIRITNETTETLNYEIQAPANWIIPEKEQGIISGLNAELIKIDIDRRNMGLGVNTGSVAINIPGKGSRTVEIVAEKLDASAAVLRLLSEGTLNFGSTIEERTIGVSNEGDNTLNWELTVSQSWISATITDGSLPPNDSQNFSIRVDRSGLPDGIHSGTVDFESNGGSGSILIVMEVKSDNSGSGEMVVTSGLRAYYTFDEGNVKDELDNYQGISIGVTTSSDTPTGNGFSLSFDGADDYVQLNGNPIMNTNLTSIHATVSLWMKSTSGGALFAIPWKESDAENEFVLGIRSGNIWHSIKRNRNCCSETGVFDTNVSSVFLDEKWHMLTITYDGASGIAKLYVDGVAFLQDAYQISNKLDAELSRIGKDYSESSAYSIADYSGKLDNIRFYSRPLSASEVEEIFNARQ